MAHKVNPDGSSKHLRMDQMQQTKKNKYDEIKQIKTLLDTEYATEQTHLKNIHTEKNALGEVRVMLRNIESVPGGVVSRLMQGNFIVPMKVSDATGILQKDQQGFLDRIHIQEVQMRKSVQQQRELRKRLAMAMDSLNKEDLDSNYKV